jgi:zinc transport system permease protein
MDVDLARTSGVRVDFVNLVLAVLAGATITLSMRVVGVLLVGALMVVPVIASLRIATGLRQTVLIAITLGVSSAVVGLVIAFYANLAPGGAVALTAIGIFVVIQGGAWLRDRVVGSRNIRGGPRDRPLRATPER